MELFTYDDSRWPLVVVRTPSAFEDGALRDAFAKFEGGFRRRERYVLVLDTSPVVSIPSAKQRALIAEWEATAVEQTRKWNIATAMVVKSALVRGTLTALAWVVPAETPRRHVPTLADAVEWSCARLLEDRVPLTPAIEAYRRELSGR